MKTIMETSATKNKAVLLHLSTLTQYFIPFGNFIFPIIIWSSVKKDAAMLDQNGKNVINFQISIFLYSLILCLVAIPIFFFTLFSHINANMILNDEEVFFENLTAQNLTGVVILAILAVILFFFLKVAEFFLIIVAAVKAAEGITYRYPLCIPFIKDGGSISVQKAASTNDQL